jgi:two-component system sensor histidine kinase UhpB
MVKEKNFYRILIAEDNPGDFFIIQDLLQESFANLSIVRADTYRQISGYLSAATENFDVILLDLSLTDRSGQDLITAMLRIDAFCPIIILTGYTDTKFSIQSISQGISDYLIKEELNAPVLHKSILYSIQRMKAISELKDSEKRYNDLFHNSPQPMWVFDTDTLLFIQVNKAATDLYGYSAEDFLDMQITDIQFKEDDELMGNDGKILHLKKTGDIMEMEIYCTPIVLNGRKFISVIAIDVTDKNSHQQALVKAIIKTQEDERYEIGSELHDNVCQILAACLLNLAGLKEIIPPEKHPVYVMCAEHINLALEEIRNLSHRLAPAFYAGSTLEDAFSKLLNTYKLDGEMDVRVNFNEGVKNQPIGMELQLNLFRILQEQLRNILKYAKATLIEVDLLIYHNQLIMKIMDNGVGFDMETVKKGIGMANMKRRAELFSGNFEFYSVPGSGSEIIVDIPFPEAVNSAGLVEM